MGWDRTRYECRILANYMQCISFVVATLSLKSANRSIGKLIRPTMMRRRRRLGALVHPLKICWEQLHNVGKLIFKIITAKEGGLKCQSYIDSARSKVDTKINELQLHANENVFMCRMGRRNLLNSKNGLKKYTQS